MLQAASTQCGIPTKAFDVHAGANPAAGPADDAAAPAQMVDPGAPASAEELASWQFSELMYRILVLGLGAPAFPVNHRDLHEAGGRPRIMAWCTA